MSVHQGFHASINFWDCYEIWGELTHDLIFFGKMHNALECHEKLTQEEISLSLFGGPEVGQFEVTG